MRPGTGPIPASIMLVGEAFGEEEELKGIPFIGTSGHALDVMLREAGIERHSCRITNLVNARPLNNDMTSWIPVRKKDITPGHVRLHDRMVLPIVQEGYKSLMFEIEQTRPKVVVALGNYAMWALTGKWGIDKWRGSAVAIGDYIVLPTYHPAYILRVWEDRSAAVQDLRRVGDLLTHGIRAPAWTFVIRPSYQEVEECLTRLMSVPDLWLDLDIETSLGHIECLGLSWSTTEALCIPFKVPSGHYWSEGEEIAIVWQLYKLLTRKGTKVRWQNGLYDAQYIFKSWGFVPNHGMDTMIAWHTLFPGLPKRLDYQASMLCDNYVQWKPDRVKQKEGG